MRATGGFQLRILELNLPDHETIARALGFELQR